MHKKDTVLYALVGRKERPVCSVDIDDPNHDDLIAAERQRFSAECRASGVPSPAFRVERGVSAKPTKSTAPKE